MAMKEEKRKIFQILIFKLLLIIGELSLPLTFRASKVEMTQNMPIIQSFCSGESRLM